MVNVAGCRPEGLGFLFAASDFERRDAGSQPDRARSKPSDDVAEEMEAEIHSAVSDGQDEDCAGEYRQRTPES